MELLLLKKSNGEKILLRKNATYSKLTYIYKDLLIRLNVDKKTLLRIKKMSKCKTTRIIMPLDVVYNAADKEIGYIYKKQKQNLPIKRIENISSSRFLSEMAIIEEDIEKISINHIFLKGLKSKNISITSSYAIYIEGIEEYEILENISYHALKVYNREIVRNIVNKVVRKYLNIKVDLNINKRLDDYYDEELSSKNKIKIYK